MLTKDVYYIHLIIPTETERDNSYDVVVQLSDLEGAHKLDTSIAKYDARFFSNAPSFAYTYAKVYKDHDLLIPDLQNKFDRQMLTGSPEVRNRYGIVGYDKYLYFGVKYILESKMLNKIALNYRSIRYSNNIFNPKIRSVDKILQEYHRAERKLKTKTVVSHKDSERSLKGDAGIYKNKPKEPVSPVAPKAKIKSSPKTAKRIKKK